MYILWIGWTIHFQPFGYSTSLTSLLAWVCARKLLTCHVECQFTCGADKFLAGVTGGCNHNRVPADLHSLVLILTCTCNSSFRQYGRSPYPVPSGCLRYSIGSHKAQTSSEPLQDPDYRRTLNSLDLLALTFGQGRWKEAEELRVRVIETIFVNI
jgi:hypothetical protein